MAIGDLVSFIGGEFVGEGRLLTKTDEPSKFTVLGSSVETNSTPDGSTWSDKPKIKTPFGNNQSWLHPASIYGLGDGVNSYVRITPSTVSGLQSAVAHFVHAAGHTQDSEFLEGFSSGAVPSSVLIGSGRVSMMSVSGVEPTGIALHNLISPPVGKGTNSETHSYNKSSTFIESGAFTTYIGGGNSRGFWQNLEDLPDLGNITNAPKKVAGYPSPIPRSWCKRASRVCLRRIQSLPVRVPLRPFAHGRWQCGVLGIGFVAFGQPNRWSSLGCEGRKFDLRAALPSGLPA